MGDDVRYSVRELKAAEHGKIRQLIANADRWEALFVRDAAADPAAAEGWWFGALRDGTTLEALLHVVGHTAHLYSADRAATRMMADSLRKQQEVLGAFGGAKRHQILGEALQTDDFWTIFKDTKGRKLISDRFRHLMVSGELPAKSPSKRIRLGYATPHDARVVYDFTAERLLEAQGYDPRRQAARAHAARCQQVIAEQRQLLGKEGDKPVFVAELRELDEGTVMLDNVFVPLALRTRKRLIGGALFLARRAPQASGKQLILLADDDVMVSAAELAGFPKQCTYRHIVTYG